MTESNRGILVSEAVVKPEWIDINGHMNVAYYVLAFDYGVDALWESVGITEKYVEDRQLSTFAVDAHITYRQELHEGDPYRIVTQILALDEKRLHQFQRMYHARDNYLAATAEWLNLHVSLETRRVCPFPDDILSGFIAAANAQTDLSMYPQRCNKVRVKNPVYAMQGYNLGNNTEDRLP